MKRERPEIVVYVAGKYRAPTVNGIHQNIQAARAIATHLWRPGVAVICPHLNTAFFDGAAPDSVWLDGDLAILERCDAVVLVPGWEESRGATEEVRFANANAIPVFATVLQFDQWYAARQP